MGRNGILTNEEKIEEILITLDSPGWKFLQENLIKEITNLCDLLDNEENTRDKDMFLKGQICFGKNMLTKIDSYKKL